MYKVCKVIWSTNRLEYLIPTLKSQASMIDWSGCEVHGIFIDDMPKGRHDGTVRELAKMFGYDEVILNPVNQGITVNWTNTFKMLSERGYDYVYHSEDDVVLNHPVHISELIDIIRSDPVISQVCLSRQAWYVGETDPVLLDEDRVYSDKYQYEYAEDYFWTLASLYRNDITRYPYHEYTEFNLSEYVVAQALKQSGLKTAKLKNRLAGAVNIVDHIGSYSIGKRVEPGEPGWHKFYMYDPAKKYDSRLGHEWK